jgi:hypothetical protein
MRRLVQAAAALVLLAGCTTFDAHMQKGLNRNIGDVIMDAGAPTAVADLPNGWKAYTWIVRRGDMECRMNFAVDPEGITRRYSYSGCPQYLSE